MTTSSSSRGRASRGSSASLSGLEWRTKLSKACAAREKRCADPSRRALRSVGLSPDVTADLPTSEGVLAAVSAIDLKGRQVGVQLYPGFPGGFLPFLTQAGAEP